MSDEIRIRPGQGRADCDGCVLLQRAVWGLQDLEITSALQLLSGLHAGGLLHLAEAPGGAPVGFAWAVPALRGGHLQYHSDMLAVLPEFQQRGVGPRLKWAQRDGVLRRGIERLTWTFDPLQARNAHLNLRRLGALGTEFHEDFYGRTSSPLHHGLPTDRLLVAWELRAPRVEALARSPEPPRSVPAPELPYVNVVKWQAGWPVSSDPDLGLSEPELLLEIPPEWDVLCQAAPLVAQGWQARVRAALRHYLGNGYAAADLLPTEDRGRRRPLYLLRRA